MQNVVFTDIYWYNKNKVIFMYRIGDKIFCPYYGVGVIKEIATKEVLGEKHKYYIIHLTSPKMKLMIRVEKAEEKGVRQIISTRQIHRVLDTLRQESDEAVEAEEKSLAAYWAKVKSSNILTVAEAVREFLRKDQIKGLGRQDKELFKRSLEILSCEIACVKGIKKSDARALILDSCREGFERAKAAKQQKAKLLH